MAVQEEFKFILLTSCRGFFAIMQILESQFRKEKS